MNKIVVCFRHKKIVKSKNYKSYKILATKYSWEINEIEKFYKKKKLLQIELIT